MTDGDGDDALVDPDAESDHDRSADPDVDARPDVDDEPDDDIPLQIVGHEDRTPPGESAEDALASLTDDGGATERDDTGDADDVEGAGDGLVDDADADNTDTDEADDDTEDPTGDADATDGTDADDADGDFAYPDVVEEVGDDEVEPVELLVQLAKDGEIDPWDIDIVAVTDKFLEALDEADLRTSGRALFYASVLLRMKSDELFAVGQPDPEEEVPPWEAPFAEEPADDGGEHPPGFDPVDALEAEMDRRLERKHARGKPETLDELVRELRDAERGSWWKESRTYDTSGSPRGWDRGVQELSYHSGDDFRVEDEPTADDVTHTAHEEDIEAIIEDVEAALEPHFEAGREEVLYAEIEEAGGSRVMTYLALLFLAHRGRVRLEQDELFEDLWIQQATVEVEASEAIAD